MRLSYFLTFCTQGSTKVVDGARALTLTQVVVPRNPAGTAEVLDAVPVEVVDVPQVLAPAQAHVELDAHAVVAGGGVPG